MFVFFKENFMDLSFRLEEKLMKWFLCFGVIFLFLGGGNTNGDGVFIVGS